MRLLLDTHTLLWAMRNNPKLSRNAQQATSDLGNEGYVSVVSVWEAATKFRNGKLPEAAPLVHSANERIDVRDLGVAADFYTQVARQLLG